MVECILIADYGARFNAWLNSDNREPYNSFGNGSAGVFLKRRTRKRRETR